MIRKYCLRLTQQLLLCMLLALICIQGNNIITIQSFSAFAGIVDEDDYEDEENRDSEEMDDEEYDEDEDDDEDEDEDDEGEEEYDDEDEDDRGD